MPTAVPALACLYRGAGDTAPNRDTMLKGFMAFLARGNVLDLAIAVVVGGAFGAVVTSLVKDLLTPLIAAVFGKPNFANLHFTIHNSVFAYGDFLNACIAFLSISATIYFVVVAPTQRLLLLKNGPPELPQVVTCPECLSEIPAAAKRCKFCTAAVVPSAPAAGTVSA